MELSELILKNHETIKKYLYLGYVNWDDLINRIERQERNKYSDFADEQIWTFLIACGYAIKGRQGVAELCTLLTGLENLHSEKIWIEVLPISPREKEGQTHLDLAIGDIDIRPGTESGIELIPKNDSWIAFCEMKWYSDISYNVSYDQQRNQLARVIENALTFQKNGIVAEKIFVALVTPKTFKNSTTKSRLYNYKYEEYRSTDKLINDFNNCGLEKVNKEEWQYPNIKDRAAKLSLNWITFETLLNSLPVSDISEKIKEFEQRYNKTKMV
jgi:hypothetical protein